MYNDKDDNNNKKNNYPANRLTVYSDKDDNNNKKNNSPDNRLTVYTDKDDNNNNKNNSPTNRLTVYTDRDDNNNNKNNSPANRLTVYTDKDDSNNNKNTLRPNENIHSRGEYNRHAGLPVKNTFVWMVSGYYILLVLLPLHLVPTFVWGRCLMTIYAFMYRDRTRPPPTVPFSSISSVTMSNRILVCRPLFLHPCTSIYSPPSYVMVFYSHHMPIPVQHPFLEFL